MGDSGTNPEVSTGIHQPVNRNRVTKGIRAAVAGAVIMGAGVTACAPRNVSPVTEQPKTDPDKVLSVLPSSYASELGTVVPIEETPITVSAQTLENPQNNPLTKEAEERAENNAEVLKDDLGLGKNGEASNYEILPGGIILVERGKYGLNDNNQAEAIRLAVEEWNKIDLEFSKKMTEQGTKAIAANIAGYGEEGYWQQGREGWGFSYNFKKGVILINLFWKYDKIKDAKIGYMGPISQEAYGIYYSQFLIPNPKALDEKIIWVEKAFSNPAEKQEKIDLLKSWFPFKKNYEHLDEKRLLESYPFSAAFKEALESEKGQNELLEDIRVVKLVALWGDLERYHSEGRIKDEAIYERIQGRALLDLDQVLRDHFKAPGERQGKNSGLRPAA